MQGFQFGVRGNEFKQYISNFLSKYIQEITIFNLLKERMDVFEKVFTSERVDETANWQIFEQLGDLSINKAIVSFVYAKYPFLRDSRAVKVVARVRINIGSKSTFHKIGKELGFLPYISALNEDFKINEDSLVEDVFEAIFGAIETLIDEQHEIGYGYQIVYRMYEQIMREMDEKNIVRLSLAYDDLYDAKTRFKEVCDLPHVAEAIGKLQFVDSVENETKALVSVYAVKTEGMKSRILISTGMSEAPIDAKMEAHQDASRKGLIRLREMGYWKNPNSYYLELERLARGENVEPVSERKVDQKEVEQILADARGEGEGINKMFNTKHRNKFQRFYASTILAMYCRQQNEYGVRQCLRMGADVFILDSDGMSCMDLALVGGKDKTRLDRIVKRLKKAAREAGKKIPIREEVKRFWK